MRKNLIFKNVFCVLLFLMFENAASSQDFKSLIDTTEFGVIKYKRFDLKMKMFLF